MSSPDVCIVDLESAQRITQAIAGFMRFRVIIRNLRQRTGENTMLNCFTAVGRVAKRTCKRSSTGALVVKFTLAVARDKDKNGEVKTDFINCVIFGNAGNYFESYAETGAMLSVQGSIRTNLYESNGQKTVFTECLVNSYKILMPAGQKAATDRPTYPAESEILPFDLPPEMYM